MGLLRYFWRISVALCQMIVERSIICVAFTGRESGTLLVKFLRCFSGKLDGPDLNFGIFGSSIVFNILPKSIGSYVAAAPIRGLVPP